MDNLIAERLLARDPEALALLIDNYGGRLYRLVERIASPPARKEDIEECVSDVFVAAWEQADRFSPEKGSLLVWLHMLAKYKALDMRRKLGGKPVIEPFEREPAADGAETERTVIAKEEVDMLLRQVDTFEPLNRTIFYKRYFYYESVNAIARHTGLTAKAVEHRLGRMRKALKSHEADLKLAEEG